MSQLSDKTLAAATSQTEPNGSVKVNSADGATKTFLGVKDATHSRRTRLEPLVAVCLWDLRQAH